MIQYGEVRIFKESGSEIRAIPKFNPAIDPDLTPDAPIDSIVITNMNGEQRQLERMKHDIQQRYKGAPYSVWMQGVRE